MGLWGLWGAVQGVLAVVGRLQAVFHTQPLRTSVGKYRASTCCTATSSPFRPS